MFRFTKTLICALAAALTPGLAMAEDAYPQRPIRLVVGFAAGGSTDIPARFVAEKLGALLGQRVIVENKSAAAGMVATRDVLAQPRDGYSLLLCTHFESINTAVYRNTGFQLADLAPISLIAKYYYGLALSNTVPAADFKSFVDYAKAHPNEISYGTVGSGSAQEIFARQLERLAGITMNKVPYRGGAPAMQDLLPGRIQFFASPMLSIIPYYQQKQLKILGVSSTERLAAVPDVPTLREQGVDFVRFGWLGICAGKGTPPDVIARLNREINAALADPAIAARLKALGTTVMPGTPADFARLITEDTAKWAEVVKRSGAKPD
jgi:tripartite-type tricarboxylate transporter receptor subunit TctC